MAAIDRFSERRIGNWAAEVSAALDTWETLGRPASGPGRDAAANAVAMMGLMMRDISGARAALTQEMIRADDSAGDGAGIFASRRSPNSL